MLELRGVDTFYGNIQALKQVSIDVAEGEIVTLIGANGAGKTTTLMSICGVVPPRRGEIAFRGDAHPAPEPGEDRRPGDLPGPRGAAHLSRR